jgi:hypothetical protein
VQPPTPAVGREVDDVCGRDCDVVFVCDVVDLVAEDFDCVLVVLVCEVRLVGGRPCDVGGLPGVVVGLGCCGKGGCETGC